MKRNIYFSIKKIIILNGLFFILVVTSCYQQHKITLEEKEQIYKEKGYEEMDNRLKPEIIPMKESLFHLLGVNYKNTLGGVNYLGEFVLVKVDEKEGVKIEVILPGFPPLPGGEYYSDNEHNVLWLVRNRGFYALDIATKTKGHIIATNILNAKIRSSYLKDVEKKILFISTAAPHPAGEGFILYDLFNDKKIFDTDDLNIAYIGVMYPFYDNKYLFCDFIEKNDKTINEWRIYDHELNICDKDNKLIEQLNKFQIDVWKKTKTIHLGKRILFGSSFINDDLVYFTVRWDEKMDDIKAEPLLLQIPENVRMQVAVHFSPDGQWLKTTGEYKTGLVNQVPELFIYHVSNIYPQGLSLPIPCGYTRKHNSGAFMQHDTWGPCYVELDDENQDKLFVYKLNDGLKLLAEEVKNEIKS